MRCKTCQYALWNLTGRVCPECGSPFAPSDFDFALNSVQFRCPHCSQSYYGTGAQGHLVPPEFDCVSCRRHIHMDEMVLLPTAGVAEEQTRSEGSPWLERRRVGAVHGWFTTVWWAICRPTRLMRATPPESSVASAAWFALLTNGLYAATGVGGMIVLFALLRAALGAPFGGGLLGVAVFFIGWSIGMAAAVAVWALLAHGLLRLTGATAAGLGRTVQAICYSSAANFVVAVPCVNVYVGWAGALWWAIGAAVMVKEAQKVSAWRAGIAVAGPPVLLMGLGVAWVGAMIGLGFGAGFTGASGSVIAGGQSQAALAMARPSETKVVLDALLAHAQQTGLWPDHAARLVVDKRLGGADLGAGGSGTQWWTISVGGSPLPALETMGDQASAVASAGAALPPGTAAYRLGDYVFTYPGIDPTGGDPGLWVVVCAPDAAGGNKLPNVAVPVGRLGGTVTPIASSDFSRALVEQNELRGEFGLAPLPDPGLVREGAPAVGEKPSGDGK